MDDAVKQCASCPWKKSADLAKIPGYREEKHHALADTIADPEAPYQLGGCLRMMACHHSTEGNDIVCVGWAAQQMGRGNNIALRLAARHDKRLQKLETVGPQHERFEDTLPKKRRKR
jgi:hypothetical protein